MVIHFIIEAEFLTKDTLIKRIRAAAKAQCPHKIKGALSLEIRLFDDMPLDIADCQNKRTYAEKEGLIRPVHVSIFQPRLQHIQEALHSIADKVPLQIVDLRVSQFYSMRPRIEIILNTIGDGTKSSPNKETSI
ncbi:holliday junction resolvase [Bacillus pumilus]|uniref:holliday junction resolvase n=1 Tax=Bacillus pumilus TaxID=1408 RepID=UPI0023DC359A|nr:holliday junction resolvase [Bacillus pumilus]MDF2003584.1 holliday junction resolvase [Bacillus pumilus]MDF2024627.1 holliday junction resolvase [Bacillus pumilus]MDF2028465.1 holliday junction resolvase [Bacillus pumilus]MDF2089512.1 holliday junction resolvase [Bacillus pumilus]